MSVPIAASEEGSGPPVLLLHGQPGSAGDWRGVQRALADRYRTVVPDRPGYGNTGGPPLGMVGNADAMAELLDRLDVPDAIVAGHSWGAGVALALAQRRPERVRRLVLVCPVTPGDRLGIVDRVLADRIVGAPAARAGFLAAGLALGTRQVRERLVRELPGFDSDRADELARAWRGGRVWQTFYREQRALFDELPTLRDGLTSLIAPTTVLIGARDRITDPAAGREFAADVGARLVVIERGGHMLPMQAPDEVADAIASA